MRISSCIGPLACVLGTATLAVAVCSVLFAAPDYEAPYMGSANVRLADGFDFPVGKPNALGYHKARGFTPNGHLGEDWNGDGGGDTDLGDPIYCAGNGIAVLARDVQMGWGNVIIVRHTFREPAEGGRVKIIDSLYGHLDTIGVREGQAVSRGQQIATMGTAHGMYDAHLHFEVRKNINIGMYRSSFARDFSTYYDPTEFVNSHRTLRGGGSLLIALNTFTPTPGGAALPPSEAGYELGINRSPARLADAESAKLNKSAYTIKRRPTTAFDQINDRFKVDRFGDMKR
jgi:murein DD-endopeptidase MepM/ murein hydrolase activator NlpD